jgi:hypothetical protein
MRVEGDAALELKRADPSAGAAALEHFADDLSRKHANKESVVVHALEDLRGAPEEALSGREDETLSEDWLNMFSSHSENASSDHLRRMWGKVLAGEIRTPGSFSLSTLRFISELDRDIATKFQSAVRHRLMGSFILKADDLQGEPLLDLVFLEEVGLLQQVAGIGGLNISNKFNTDGKYIFRHGRLLLIAKGPPQGDINIPVIKITRTGQEIASILPSAPDHEVIKKIATKLTSAVSIDIAMITGEADGQVAYILTEKLK